MKDMSNKDTGFFGENMAASYLINIGYEIIHRNWRYKHLEIDILACKNGKLHIVEVKTRTATQFGYPEQMITLQKMQFLKNAAAHFQYQNPKWKWLQFDVIAIYKTDNNEWVVDYFEDVYF
jgi:putative endonuclease